MNPRLIVILGLFVMAAGGCPTDGEKLGLQKFFQFSDVLFLTVVVLIAVAVHIRQRGIRWI